MTLARTALCLSILLSLIACGPPSGNNPSDDVADLSAVPRARAECEEPTPQRLKTGPLMLPGTLCQECHKKGGQAANYAWTFSGTVFGSKTSACNPGGIEGVTVEIRGSDGGKLTLTTNAVGNFYTTQTLKTPITAKVSKGSMSKEMLPPTTTTACATCHTPAGVAGGRIYLN